MTYIEIVECIDEPTGETGWLARRTDEVEGHETEWVYLEHADNEDALGAAVDAQIELGYDLPVVEVVEDGRIVNWIKGGK